MEITEQHLNILVQSSDYYAPIAGVMLTSLFENNKDIEKITVYLMTGDMSEKNRTRFQALAEQYRRTIKFIDAAKIDSFLDDHQLPKYRNSYAAYYKMFALEMIEDKLDRLIYLDADMVVTGSLIELITYDLGANTLGMCLDTVQLKYKKMIKCNSQFFYNTGMIVFDVKKWRETRCMNRIIEHITQVHAAYPVVDQDLMNIVFSNQITTIPLKYNCITPIFVYRDYNFLTQVFGTENYYSEKEVAAARDNPIILHFLPIFGLRPWYQTECPECPNKDLWNKYREISLWSGFTFPKQDVSTLFKIQRFLFRYLPHNLFATINRNCIYAIVKRKAKKMGIKM